MTQFALLLLLFLVQSASAGETFQALLRSVAAAPDSASRARIVATYLARTPSPIVEDGVVTFLYAGAALNAAVPSEINSWDPEASPMTRVEGTNLFFRVESLPTDARLEYKLWADSSWMPDPRNPRRAAGGYGENSDLWMPRYVQSVASRYTPGIRRGRLDTLRIPSARLGHPVPVYVYTPASPARRGRFPVLYVTDGGDYLTLGRLDVILDNMIAAKKIVPVLAVFIDPRSVTSSGEPKDFRMTEYAANEDYLDFLETELAPMIEARFSGSDLAEQRVLLGSSLGGIEATYAVLERPNFISNCAAQSPAYLYGDSTVVDLALRGSAKGRYVYISTGTLRDTEREATTVAGALRKNGAVVTFEVTHEGHNWTNWRSKLPKILETFFPRK